MMKKITALLLVPLLLAGCSAEGNVETLLRAPQLSGESAALQKALNSYLGGSATLKYPANGDFLSPFAFGDWDGDGTDEAAILYTTDTTSSNVWLAVLEPSGDSCLCIVFSNSDNYAIGSRPTVLGALEKYVEEQYGKTMYFKARMRNAGERLNTIYVSDEELKNAIHMDITIED